MKRISAIAMSLLLMIGLTAEAQAATSGAITCRSLVGNIGSDSVELVIMVYNPNATGQQGITRFRIFDFGGGVAFDQSFAPPIPVFARGSFPISSAVFLGFAAEGVQIVVNWSQTVDTAAAPIGRINMLTHPNIAGASLTSVSQFNCP